MGLWLANVSFLIYGEYFRRSREDILYKRRYHRYRSGEPFQSRLFLDLLGLLYLIIVDPLCVVGKEPFLRLAQPAEQQT